MKRSATLRLLICILFSTLLASPRLHVRAETVWTVDDDGPADFSTIQGAIYSAQTGDTIYVSGGTYFEHLIVDKSLSIIGEDRDTTIIDGGGTGTVIKVSANNVSISGFTVKNSSPDGLLFDSSGILLFSAFSRINDNHVMNTQAGIYLYSATDNVIQGNSVKNSSFYGVLLDYSDRNTVSDNLIAEGGFGIGLDTSSSNTLSSNAVANNTWYGIYIYCFEAPTCNENTVESNRIVSNGGGVQLAHLKGSDVRGNFISENRGSGIGLASSNSSSISGNIIKNNSDGIYLMQHSNNNTLTENLISFNDVGIRLRISENNTVHHNNFLNNSVLLEDPRPPMNRWDDGYPSGGNFWSDYSGSDFYSGPEQTVNGSDGIGDTPYIIAPNNRDRYPLMKPFRLPIEFHNVALISAIASEDEVHVGQEVTVTIIVRNEGTFTETFQVNLLFEAEETDYLITSTVVSDLPPLFNTTISLGWTPASVSEHTLRVRIPSIPDEMDTHDNMLVAGKIKVKKVGDLNSDGKVDIKDIAHAALAFGSRPGHLRWNSEADINKDNVVDIHDLVLVAKNFGG